MKSPGAASQPHPARKGVGVPNRGGTTCCILLPGAAVVARSRSVTFSTSKNPVRPFPCCVVASGKDFAQVKGQIPGLLSHLCWWETSCASFGMTHVERDDVPPGYGACSSWEKCGALASHGHLLQTGEGERCRLGRAHVLRVVGVLEGNPSPGSPSPPPAISLPCRAIEKLSDHQFENYSFKISYIPDEEVSSPPPPQRSRRGGHSSRERGSSPGGSSQPKQLDFPLRMLVPTQFVGAIIGKEGLTIKNLTKQTQSK